MGDKKGGLFAGLGDLGQKLVAELSEPEDGKARPPSAHAPEVSTPATYSPAPVMSIPQVVAADSEAVDMVSQQVLVDMVKGHKSRYLSFVRLFDKLAPQIPNETARATAAVSAMQAMDDTITAQAIMEDINAHLGLLDSVHASADHDAQTALQSMVGAKESEIADLQSQNQKATEEIARHQSEISQRNTRIAAAQQERADAEAKIARAKGRADAAELTLRTQLQNQLRLVSAL